MEMGLSKNRTKQKMDKKTGNSKIYTKLTARKKTGLSISKTKLKSGLKIGHSKNNTKKITGKKTGLSKSYTKQRKMDQIRGKRGCGTQTRSVLTACVIRIADHPFNQVACTLFASKLEVDFTDLDWDSASRISFENPTIMRKMASFLRI